MAEQKSKWEIYRKPFLRSFIPVGLTYSFTIVGVQISGDELTEVVRSEVDKYLGLFVVPLVTTTHAIIPIFIIRFVAFRNRNLNHSETAEDAQRVKKEIFLPSVFVSGVWFGVPICILINITGWFAVIPLVIHVAFARWGTKVWTFLEYGSTTFSLGLFMLFYTPENILPFGLMAVVFQIILLTFLDLWGRPLWVEEAEEQPQ